MKKIIIAVALIAVVGGAIGLYMFNKPTSDTSRMNAEVSVEATEIMRSFSDDEEAANDDYLGKVVEVTGVVEKVGSNDDGTAVIHLVSGDLMGAVVCNMSKPLDELGSTINEGDRVIIKGVCSGYLMDVILERAVIVN